MTTDIVQRLRRLIPEDDPGGDDYYADRAEWEAKL
jgi:hypothetical protein